MSRSYGKVFQRIWADPTWRALDVDAQHLYLLLISQPSINLAGVLPMQLRRWTSCVSGWEVEQVAGALDRLTAAGLTVVDEDTEEVLVRSFIRNDEAFRIPGALKAICAAAATTQSAELRPVLAAELSRLPALEGKTARAGMALVASTRRVLDPDNAPPPGEGEPFPEGATDTIPGLIPEPIAEPIGEPIPEPIGQPIPEPSVSVSVSVPSLTSSSSSVSRASAKDKTGSDEGFDRFYAAYPRKQARPDALKAWKQVTKRTDPQVIMSGLARYQFSDERRYVPMPATWLRQERWNDQQSLTSRHLTVLAGGDDGVSLTKQQIDEILGPDYWQVPTPPQERYEEDPRIWAREQATLHRAERVQKALAVLRERQEAQAR